MRIKFTRTVEFESIPSELSKLICDAMVQIRQAEQMTQNSYAYSCLSDKTAECVYVVDMIRKVLYNVDTVLSDAQEMANGYITTIEEQAARSQEQMQQNQDVENVEETEETQAEENNDQVD